MCGIAGFTTFHTSHEDTQSLIKRMTFPLTPRGPDGEGYYIDEYMALGHRRLSIIDLKKGSQPMSIEGGRYHIVFNGEIYNFIELRTALETKGRIFTTRSDTEVILHQYAIDGLSAVEKLNGMFAFAIWDRANRSIFLVRDRIGEKPLYYTVLNGELIFASELKSILMYPEISKRINLQSVSKYLTFGYVPAPNTIFEGIFKLEPGTLLLFTQNELFKKTYWEIPLEDNPLSSLNFRETAEHLIDLLTDSISKRLRSDVPLGIFLSGGIDSSAVTALASRVAGTNLQSFSIGFEESSYDESCYAKKVADLFNTKHHHEILSLRRAIEILPNVMEILDEPFADASIVPTYLLSQTASRQVKVVLGGDGGDELFAGYPSFLAHKIMERISFLPITWRDVLSRLAKNIPCSYNYTSIDFLLQQFIKGAGISPEIRFMLWMGYSGNEQREQILTPEVNKCLLRENPYEDVINYVRKSGLINDFQRITYLCMKLYLQDGILVKVDRASMANSLEVRSPFLDHNLVEFACRMHPSYKLNIFTSKYILKYALKGLLPKEIINRRKAGFMIPVASWLVKDLRQLLDEMCSEEKLKNDGLFNPVFVRRLINEHMNRVHDHRKVLWALLCFQLWKRNYGT